MSKEYNFTLTYPEAVLVVDALKTKPMNQVEMVVKKLDEQYIKQHEQELAATLFAETPATPAPETTSA